MNFSRTFVGSVMCYDRLPEGAFLMLESAKYHGINVKPIGGWRHETFALSKVFNLWNTLRNGTGYDHIIMVDAADTLFATGLREIFTKWESYNSDFVISCEAGCWPHPTRWRDKAPDPGHKFKHLNSGFYMATWDAWLRTMRQVVEMPVDFYQEHGTTIQDCDQARFTAAWMQGMIQVKLDTNCLLSQSSDIFGNGDNLITDDSEGGKRPKNKITGSYPCTFHMNSNQKKWCLRPLLDMMKQ